MPLPQLLSILESLDEFRELLGDLPGPASRRGVGGLQGSSDAVIVATVSMNLTHRFFVVLNDDVAGAERWLADLSTLVEPDGVAFYPPRESFGEAEAHAEVAGERVETLERIGRGDLRIVVTTSRALLERTQLPRALASARVELRKGDTRRPEELAAHLEAIGFERVPMVEDVAQFSVRGGIFDIYSFGMAEPVRLEFWGDDITELRHFDLLTQRSTRDADVALVLPVDGQISVGDVEPERSSIRALFPPDTLFVIPRGTHVKPEMERTWSEAQHHIDLARRRGEDTPSRDELFESPDTTIRALGAYGTIDLSGDDARIVFPFREPEEIQRDMKRLKQIVADGIPTTILCDNAGQAERLDELLNDDRISPATLAIGVLDGGFVIPPRAAFAGYRVLTDHEIFRRERRFRRARRYATGAALESLTALKPGDYVVHLEHGVGIYRGIEKIFVRESTVEVAVIEYEGGDRLNVPLYRIDQIERYRSAADITSDAPPPRLHALGGKRWASQRDKTRAAIQEMTVELLDLYARRKVATRPPHLPDTVWQRQLESS
ncbi:MAG TPA: CarD family transcriptional regulator, partial [Gemmatimonadaceae bacterium]|nr:CarD family transcriptional regulator [Gemmatimonadaceae bacterium]